MQPIHSFITLVTGERVWVRDRNVHLPSRRDSEQRLCVSRLRKSQREHLPIGIIVATGVVWETSSQEVYATHLSNSSKALI